MNWLGMAAVGGGAALGAWVRWGLGALWNPVFSTLPLGTLAANLFGGYLIGVALGFFTEHAGLAPEWRLLIVTGFLGGLTTFSTFSAETMTLLLRAQYVWAVVTVLAHVTGSLAMTLAGIWTVHFFRG